MTWWSAFNFVCIFGHAFTPPVKTSHENEQPWRVDWSIPIAYTSAWYFGVLMHKSLNPEIFATDPRVIDYSQKLAADLMDKFQSPRYADFWVELWRHIKDPHLAIIVLLRNWGGIWSKSIFLSSMNFKKKVLTDISLPPSDINIFWLTVAARRAKQSLNQARMTLLHQNPRAQ